MASKPNTRGAARCCDCGRVYAVRTTAAGDLIPIGNVTGCTCGATTFRKLG